MTLLIASAFVHTAQELERAAAWAQQAGADALEARIDAFTGPTTLLRAILQGHGPLPILLTCRSQAEGGQFAGDGVEAGLRTLGIAEQTGAWIDIELGAWRSSGELREQALAYLAANSEAKLILSAHFQGGLPGDIEEQIEEVLRISPKIIAKVAYVVSLTCGLERLVAEHPGENFAAFDLMARFGSRVIAICMGETGAWTRILAPKFGTFATFASITAERTTAAGQPTILEFQNDFRWKAIERDTKVFGVVGAPIAHSLSPKLFNRWFAEHEINAVFVPLRVEGEELQGFLDECRRRPWLDVHGLSVTIPHKVAALNWAGDCADPMSKAIGAANTVVLNETAVAYNTDCYAAVDSLAVAMGQERSELHGLSVDVLGAGGAARAVCYGLREMGCRVTVFARSSKKAAAFSQWGATVCKWEERTKGGGEVLIQCTPLGIWPKTFNSPMPPEALRGRKLVFDLIYRPLKTRLLLDAETVGCRTLSGLDMFVRQAASQFALWTGLTPDMADASRFLRGLIEAESRDRPRIALIGARGSGKSTVGALLAELLNVPHVDTDGLIEAAAGKSIAEIFASEGEAGFRRRELSATLGVLLVCPAVISLGGGFVLHHEEDWIAMRRAAKIVWLTAPADVLAERIQSDPKSPTRRPRLTAKSAEEEMEEILGAREPLYRNYADFVVDTSKHGADEVARQIVALIAADSSNL